MDKTYRAWSPHQMWLLPPSPRDWLPADDMVYFLMDVIETMDISSIAEVYEKSERGYPPYHPRMMLCLLIYSYAMGERSSRQIAERCRRDVGWRVIVGLDIPDFRTISGFRKLHLAAFTELFAQVLEICGEAGLVKLGHVSLDGTKIKANASRHKAMSYGRMIEVEARLRVEIAALLEQAKARDAAEDAGVSESGPAGVRAEKLPAELARRETRLERIKEAKAALEARCAAAALEEAARKEASVAAAAQAVPKRKRRGGVAAVPAAAAVPDKAQINFTDPESRIMKTSNKGWDQCGNAQAVVDAAGQIIVAADVTEQANDARQVQPMLTQARENLGKSRKIKKVSMDAGYFSEENVQWLEREGVDGYVATGRLKHGESAPAAPRGRKPKGLTVKQRMARKLRTKKGRAVYARRKAIVEPVFGQIKGAMGFTRFGLRGLAQMRGEWRLICLCSNLRKLFRASRRSGTRPKTA